MALQGTLKDFALPDILQLIGMQRKTGILTMESDEDAVTVQFFQGQVVGADTRLRKLEESLGSVLVRTGKINAGQLQEALIAQRQTLQRLGYVLVRCGALSEDDLREALRIQVCQIVYRLFRWRDGRYNFAPMDHLEYDRDLTIPVPAETLLMEAARMIDEWPIIEKRIRSGRVVFRTTELGRQYAEGLRAVETPGEGSNSFQSPTKEEAEILRLLDGRTAVEGIVDRSSCGEFDVYRTIYDLLQRSLIEERPSAESAHASKRATSGTVRERAALAVLGGIVIVTLATFGSNPFVPWRLAMARQQADDLREYASRGRLERIERAVHMFYLDTGTAPGDLEALAAGGYLDSRELLDPWGRTYGYRLAPEGYRLSGRDPANEPSPNLTLLHRFSPSQRMILEGPAYVGSAGGPVRP